MATSSDTPSTESLSDLFDRGFKLFNQIDNSSEDTASESFQNKVKKTILILEDATRLVSVLDLFSRNENVREIQSESLKYFLLPVLLGFLQGKLRDEGTKRSEVIRVQEAYFRDFLVRCNDYEVARIKVPEMEDDKEEEGVEEVPRMPDMAKMNKEREEKLRRYKEQKEIKERLVVIQELMEKRSADEDQVREYHLKTILSYVNVCLDEINSFLMEKPILKHMEKVRSGQAPKPKVKKTRPLKPIIITKDQMQKEVFGLGYKNVPILSIEEFYEQRVRDGWFPAPGEAKKQQSLMDRTAVDIKAQEEEEEREKEEKEERDDEEELARKRNWDEYRDTNRRGDGNRHNMG